MGGAAGGSVCGGGARGVAQGKALGGAAGESVWPRGGVYGVRVLRVVVWFQARLSFVSFWSFMFFSSFLLPLSPSPL